MIANLLRNLVIALLLHAATTLAFGVNREAAPVAVAAAPQACLLPVAAVGETAAQHSTQADTGARS